MGRILLQIIIVVLVLCLLGIVGYAYFGDLTPQTTEQHQEVTLPGGAGGK